MGTLTKTRRGKYVDGFQPLTDTYPIVSLPVGTNVVIVPGDVVTLSSGYLALATTLLLDGYLGVAVSENTAADATAEASAGTYVRCASIPIQSDVRYMVPCAANAVLAQATHVGNLYNLDGSEDAITIAAAVSTYWGFLIEEIDISDEAVAVKTYGYAIGRFIVCGAAA